MKKSFLLLCVFAFVATSCFSGNWMKRLPDHLFLSQVSIPGAHDAATGNGVALSMFSQCQDIDVATQWALGVRAFDLRPVIKDDYLNINHGIAPTELRFDDALFLLRDSLKANPTEFAVIHMLYATGYADDKEEYAVMLKELLEREELKDYFVEFRSDLTVGDMRGKMLLLSRDTYAGTPYTGGFFQNWCGWLDWNAQTACTIIGPNRTLTNKSTLYVQDFSNTTDSNGGVNAKVEAVKEMLGFSTRHVTETYKDVVWVFNFASAYPGDISTANGYRENATYTNAAVIEYLKENEPGPTGVVMMDYVGVDVSSGDYQTRGKEALDSIIVNNYKWLTCFNQDIHDKIMKRITRLYTKCEEAEETIAEECPDVAADFADDLSALRATFEGEEAKLDSLCANWLLTADYSITYSAYLNLVAGVVEDAQAAQAAYEESTGIQTVQDAKEFQIYSIQGERLNEIQSGKVNIIRDSEGNVQKRLF